MPTYVYECSTCKNQFEVMQRITEDPLTDCECGAKGTVKRVIQPIAVLFKGSGFHINDYASKGGGEVATPAEPAPAAPATPAPAAAPAPSSTPASE